MKSAIYIQIIVHFMQIFLWIMNNNKIIRRIWIMQSNSISLQIQLSVLWFVTCQMRYSLSPAFLVSTTNSATSKVCPSTRPLPNTFTLLASPISDCPTMILKGLLVTCLPFFFTLTTCSPTSLGVKEMPEEKTREKMTPPQAGHQHSTKLP